MGHDAVHPVRDAVADGFRSLGRHFRHFNSSSVTLSTPEYGYHSGRERRRRNRDSYMACSESAASSLLYNTPASGANPSPDISQGVIDPLAIAGMMIATAELDRLSSIADNRSITSRAERAPASSGGSSAANVPPNSPVLQTRQSSEWAISLPSESSGGDTGAPANTPVSGASTPIPAVLATPHVSRSSYRRRATRSRLSEVYTPEDL